MQRRVWSKTGATLILVGFLTGCQPHISSPRSTLGLEMPVLHTPDAAQNGLVVAMARSSSLRGDRNKQPFLRQTWSTSSHLRGLETAQYSKQLEAAFYHALVRIMHHHGFSTREDLHAFDTLSHDDKSLMYLLCIPTLTLQINERLLTEDVQLVTKNKATTGLLTVDGNLIMDCVEPLSEETVLIKHISFDDFHVRRSYRRYLPGNSALLTRTLLGGEFIDTSEQAFVEALNEFYPRAVTKIFTLLTAEELLHGRERVASLKAQKRS